jgi:hypothetical protein
MQVVAAVIMFNRPVQHFVLENVAVQIVFALLPFLGETAPGRTATDMINMHHFAKRRH